MIKVSLQKNDYQAEFILTGEWFDIYDWVNDTFDADVLSFESLQKIQHFYLM
jgi:hypothetical protein